MSHEVLCLKEMSSCYSKKEEDKRECEGEREKKLKRSAERQHSTHIRVSDKDL